MPVPMPCLWPCAVPCGTALLDHDAALLDRAHIYAIRCRACGLGVADDSIMPASASQYELKIELKFGHPRAETAHFFPLRGPR